MTQFATVEQPTPELARSTGYVVRGLQRASEALHLMCYPIRPEAVQFILDECRYARSSLSLFMTALEFNADPEAQQEQICCLEDEDDSPV